MAKMKSNIPVVFSGTGKRVRVEFNGTTIADSGNTYLLRESPIDLLYFFPEEDVRTDLLEETDHTEEDENRGTSKHWTVSVDEEQAENAAFAYEQTPEGFPDLNGYIAFDWDAMDAWYIEGEEVHGHPRDPYHRVDDRQSDRHVRIEIDGVQLAETHNPLMVFETSLPRRIYIPQEDVNIDRLQASDTTATCAYKGQSSYWSAKVNDEVHEDVAWTYLEPLAKNTRLAGRICFDDSKVDVFIDGEKQEEPPKVFV